MAWRGKHKAKGPSFSNKKCPIEKGFCVTNRGGDQDGGVIKVNSANGKSHHAQASCLRKCQARKGATGCEVIWHQGNRGCYIHTKPIARGNRVARHMCWVFSKCRTKRNKAIAASVLPRSVLPRLASVRPSTVPRLP